MTVDQWLASFEQALSEGDAEAASELFLHEPKRDPLGQSLSRTTQTY